MIKSLLLLFGLVVILIGLGCNTGGTPDPPPIPHYDFSQSSKDYLYFLPESYWVYQNDTTLNTYIVKVYSTYEETRKSGEGAPEKYSYKAYWKFFSTNDTDLKKSEMYATHFSVSDNIPNSAERIYLDGNHYKTAFAPMYPFGERVNLGGEEGTFVNMELFDTMEINGKTYTGVYHSVSEDTKQDAPNTVFYHFYFAKNYGLVKYVIIRNNSTVSYSIVNASLLQ